MVKGPKKQPVTDNEREAADAKGERSTKIKTLDGQQVIATTCPDCAGKGCAECRNRGFRYS